MVSVESGRAVISWLREREEDRMIATFNNNLLLQFDLDELKSFVYIGSKHQHRIVHELVKHGKVNVLRHLVTEHGFDLNVQRASDLCTPLHMALWQTKDDVAQQLLLLGADPSIRNQWGEDASAIRTVQKPIRAQLQGCVEPNQILGLVDTNFSSFNPLDTITAYFNLARMLSKYDGEFCDWSASTTPANVCQMRSFGELTRACSDILCTAGTDTSGKLLATMLRALAMLPQPSILEALAEFLGTHPLPLGDYDAQTVHDIAWAIAKIQGGARLWGLCYIDLGNELALRVGQMHERHVSASVWAFAKAGSRDTRNMQKHFVFFRSVAELLTQNGSELTTAQSISNIAWGFATLRECHPAALGRLAEAGIRLIASFNDQNVANTAWAFATLRLEEVELYGVLMRRASSTLYDDLYKHHVMTSHHVKLLHWYQIFRAYRFCKSSNTCSAAVNSCSQQLVADLEQIAAGHSRLEGLSEGSGLESIESLMQLDEMIVDMYANGEPEWAVEIAADSMEAQDSQVPSAEAAASNAQSARLILGTQASTIEEVTVIILKFSRSPNSFRKALLDGPELAECRARMRDASCDVVLSSGAKAFVRPEHYRPLKQAVDRDAIQLYTSHVLVAEEFEDEVMRALSFLPSNAQVRQQSRDQVPVSWNMLATELTVKVARTFITISVPTSLHSRRSRAARSA